MTEEIAPQKPLYKRWEIMVPAALAAGIVVIYSIGWFVIAGIVRSQLADLRESGPGNTQFDYNVVTVGGYPFGLKVQLDGPQAAGNNWNWQGESATLSLSIFNLKKMTLTSAGTHTLTTEGRRIRINLDTAVADARIGDHGWNADINARNLSTSVDGKPAADVSSLNVTLAQDFDHPSEMALTLAADSTTLSVVPPVLEPLKTTISSVRANGALTDVQNLSRKGRKDQYPGLRIDSSKVVWGPMNASMHGQLGLDSSALAQGQLNLGLEDVERLQNTLRSTQNALPSKTTFVLELIKRVGPTSVPVSIDAGNVSLAGFRVAKIPPLKSKRSR